MDMKETLSFYRKRQELSQIDLADALGVSRQTVSKWETGAALPSAESLLALSRLYGVPVDDLLNGVETEAPPEPAPAPPPELDPSLIPRRKLIARMLAAILLTDLALFFMDISWYATSFRSGFLTFTGVLHVFIACAIGLCFAWYDRRWPAKTRTSLLIAAAALLLGLFPLLFPPPLLWRLYDLIAWGGVQTFEAVLPPNPARMFIGLVLCDEITIFFHMLCVITFQLGRLWFSRKKKSRAPQPQTAQQA
ncbi:XRE family transcriptional regulator [Colidextribacter sp. OB.20]|uniref:helix-turn-helix transcriptional regulator n=1 Tax=Colidextribacter sp. OB.20 TaxID=2304568 RepID=UPI0013709699|nr:helix-turn-helix transcriptional regulator [Colidextribacter sp. OB.20]NBI08690.1 XRE family transcriptional regulator [Colidextribacter sp. OB.20]